MQKAARQYLRSEALTASERSQTWARLVDNLLEASDLVRRLERDESVISVAVDRVLEQAARPEPKSHRRRR